jgi:hypothetical protein
MTNTYQVGDLIQVQGTFADATPTNVDPDNVEVKYTNPEGTTTTKTYSTDVEVVRSALGVFHLLITIDPALTTPHGTWYYRFHGYNDSGSPVNRAADEAEFFVEKSSF